MSVGMLSWVLAAASFAAASGPLPSFDPPSPAQVLERRSELPPAPALERTGPASSPEESSADRGLPRGSAASEALSAAVTPLSGLFGSAPDFGLTPGVLCTPQDGDFAEYRYPERIPYCRRNFSTDQKKTVAGWYGVPWEEHSKYQFDHLLSLCLGGSNSLNNLWPMPVADAREKAELEFQLCERLKRAEVTQAQAVREELSWFQQKSLRAFRRLTDGS